LSVLSSRLCDFARDAFDFDFLFFDFIGLRRCLANIIHEGRLSLQEKSRNRFKVDLSVSHEIKYRKES
jgi:hypothetical protein